MNDDYRLALRGDPDLVAGVAAHQAEALQELYVRYSGVAYALAVRMLADAAQAEACMQAAFLTFWREPQPCDPASGGFGAWLLATVHQTARVTQRATAAGVRPTLAARPATTPPPAGPGATARVRVAHHLTARRAQVRIALAALSPVQRTALEYSYFDGLTVDEIAASLKEPPMIVHMHIHDGVQHLHAVAKQPPARPSRPRKAFPAVRALADEPQITYQATVRPAPVGQEVKDVEAAPDDRSAAQRLDARQDQLLLALGHELKTPITVIKGTVQLARHRLRVGGYEQEAGWLEVANSQIDRLTSLVDYLLRAGQLDGSEVKLDLARFNLADLVRDVGLTMKALSNDHTMIVEVPQDVEIEGDVDRLRQVVSNLVNNAIKYSPAGGNVEITLRQTGGEVALCVRDYGIGIPIEERDRVFERFERATNVGQIPGFGLGLTMCRDIIQAHHGRIWVDNLSAAANAAALNPKPTPQEDGRGSLFCVALPLNQDAWR